MAMGLVDISFLNILPKYDPLFYLSWCTDEENIKFAKVLLSFVLY